MEFDDAVVRLWLLRGVSSIFILNFNPPSRHRDDMTIIRHYRVDTINNTLNEYLFGSCYFSSFLGQLIDQLAAQYNRVDSLYTLVFDYSFRIKIFRKRPEVQQELYTNMLV
uniref:Uncharacterized protein n=1 Tax=Glossina palpalis gambiensis TaxID=67801 RepID=A0A1B0BW11_9MUSC